MTTCLVPWTYLTFIFENQVANNTSFYNLEVLFLVCDRSLGFSQRNARKGHKETRLVSVRSFPLAFPVRFRTIKGTSLHTLMKTVLIWITAVVWVQQLSILLMIYLIPCNFGMMTVWLALEASSGLVGFSVASHSYFFLNL